MPAQTKGAQTVSQVWEGWRIGPVPVEGEEDAPVSRDETLEYVMAK